MTGFVDEVTIEVQSGNGGPGHVSFRREKYIPLGGPDGGDGGTGGDVIFSVQSNLKTLLHLKNRNIYKAQDGRPGGKKNKHGKDGEDIIIPVPPGTILRDPETGDILKDFKFSGEKWIFLKGGKGGLGNWHFSTPSRQAPRFAQPGITGEGRRLLIELNTIADIGLVGLPNAGKSTLLSKLTKAHPKIANYPFTTKIPNLGVMRIHDMDIILADIPGIIEGASSGAGLGLRFLKHIARTKLIVFLIDLSEENIHEAVSVLEKEIGNYAPALLKKKRLIIGTKLDMENAENKLVELNSQYGDNNVAGISALTGLNLDILKEKFYHLLKE